MSESTSSPNTTTPLNIYQKIIKVMEKVDYVVKGSTVSTGSGSAGYKAVSHDDVTGLLHKPCAEWGIVIVPSIVESKVSEVHTIKTYQGKEEKKISYRADVWVDVTFINADNPEERIVSKSFAYGMDSSDKATGKAYSMAVKYAYLKTFMLESGDNEESRDFENGNNGGSGSNRNNGQNRPANNNSPNHSGSSGNNANNQRNNHVNDNNRNAGNGNTGTTQGPSNNQGQQKNGTQNGQGTPASENQIRAIQSLCSKKGLEVGEKFKTAQSCSSQEASAEISRINAIKAQG